MFISFRFLNIQFIDENLKRRLSTRSSIDLRFNKANCLIESKIEIESETAGTFVCQNYLAVAVWSSRRRFNNEFVLGLVKWDWSDKSGINEEWRVLFLSRVR